MKLNDIWGDVDNRDRGLEGMSFASNDFTLGGPDPIHEIPRSKQARVGSRVKFLANLESLVSNPNPPARGVYGTVVLVRLAAGRHATENNGLVYVRWDDGLLRPMLRRHLAAVPTSQRVADAFRMVLSSQDIVPTFSVTSSDNELVHKSTKDLWSFSRKGDQFVLERLFDTTGQPIRE